MITYQWRIETYTDDEFEDIVEHYNFDHLSDYDGTDYTEEGQKQRLCLVREFGNERDGVLDIHYAYITSDGTLPELFEETPFRVPKKYREQFNKSIICKNIFK